jgi:hypothetical protein
MPYNMDAGPNSVVSNAIRPRVCERRVTSARAARLRR